jgi:hypothetical protein
MHFGVSGYSQPVHSYAELSGMGNPMVMANLAKAQSAPQGHFDQGGAISQTKGKVTLTPQEAAFCRKLKIPYAAFARHKAGLSR